jgi:uncharacterized protein (TIGR02300 family)
MKAEWGTKRICQSCAARFYDMRRAPIVCPKCGTTFDPEVFTKVRRARPAPPPEPKRPPVVKPPPEEALEIGVADLPPEGEAFEEVEEEGGANDEEDVIEDASELVEDDPEVGKVREKGTDEERH